MKSPGITVWAAVSYNGIVFDISDQTMTKERYVDILQNIVLPFLSETDHYQHDGAPPHFSLLARSWLDENLPGRWIGRRGPREWPPRSPDLTLLDFWLWCYIKDNVYAHGCTSNAELKQVIRAKLSNVPLQMIRNSYREFFHRCRLCVAENGGHVEHLV